MFKYMRFHLIFRNYSVKHEIKKIKKYTDTINLPKTKFPNRLTQKQREEIEKFILKHKISGSYQYQEAHKSSPAFVLHDGPPYANGDLHMGHAVNKLLKDITLRQHVARGRKVNYRPGWDCHGLPIELKAINSVDETLQDAQRIRQKSREFAMQAVARQKQEFESWGILSDWEDKNIYLTLRPNFIKNQLKMFYDFYERNLVFRDLKPVFWSPSSKTALAESELEYNQNHISPSVYVRFEMNKLPSSLAHLPEKIYALVWTTTPWTLPSNQAICYNPTFDYALAKFCDSDDVAFYLLAKPLINDLELALQRKFEIIETVSGAELSQCSYKDLVQKGARTLSFIAAAHVQNTKGTGLVHTAPAHGHDDFLVCLAEKIPVLNYINETGCYNDEAPTFLRGKNVFDPGNKLVLEHIADDVVFATELQHSYPIDWRTKKPVILRASDQWFMNTEVLKDRALEEIENIEIYPRANSDNSKKALCDQIRKRPYWCISRQRSWGVPIPVFYQKGKGTVINRKLIDHLCDLVDKAGNIDFWWTQSVTELVPQSILDELNCTAEDLTKGEDIFDIWFDSGSTWSAVLQGNQVADLYLEGYDQFNGWFQSSLLTSIAARNKAPYKAIFVHGFTVDEHGYKMSKSLGNVISPKDITKKYGTDVLRWWVASHGTQHTSIAVSEKLLDQAAQSVAKIRSTLRYLNGVIGPKSNEIINENSTCHLNKYLLSSLVDFETQIESHYKNYEYNRVTATVQNFVVNQISAIYLHLIKDRLYCGTASEFRGIQTTLTHCYKQLCKALWPITPFLIEESWNYYDDKLSFHTQSVESQKDWHDADAMRIVNAALDLKRLISLKSNNSNSWCTSVTIICHDVEQLKDLQKLHNTLNSPDSTSELCEILQVGEINLQYSTEKPKEEPAILINSLDSALCARCRRYLVTNAHDECERCSAVLKSKQII